MRQTIGFIGSGNMATAIYTGILDNDLAQAQDLVLYDIDADKLNSAKQQTGCKTASSNVEVVQQSDVIFLAVKPQYMPDVAAQIKGFIRPEAYFVSIVAGWSNEKLKNALGSSCRLIRVMPNTPLLVGSGMSCLCLENDLTEDEFKAIQCIFAAMGRTMNLHENQIAAFSSVAGSGPAYVYIFIEAMADAACKLGLPRSIAYEMAAQTCIGSGEMVLKTGKHPAELKDAVCSPGGTTIEGVHALEQGCFRAIVMDAIERCTEKFLSLT